jgi:hypothetical protein
MQHTASPFRLLLLMLVGVVLAACGSGTNLGPSIPDNTPTISETMSMQQAQAASNNLELQAAPPERQAVFDFSATVSDGPSKDTTLSGKLSVELKRAGEGGQVFMGALVDGNSSIPAKGVLTKKGRMFLFLEVSAATEDVVVGIGQRDGDGNFSGSFLGPKTGDRGAWTAKVVSLPNPPQPAPEVKKTYGFSALITDGADKGKTLEGRLELTLRQREGLGQLEGTLKLGDGTEGKVRGNLMGGRNGPKRVLLIVEFGRDSRLMGEGKLNHDSSLEGVFVLAKRSAASQSTSSDGASKVSRGTWKATSVQ